MNELALFAGAGGGILGGHLLGWRTVCAVEFDPYARDVLVARQNDGCLAPFPIWDDIRTFDGRPWRGRVDVVSGGFPCQDISAAGKGVGITGERSGLWSEMARVIGEIRPRFVLVENSPMLVGRGLGLVLGDLSKMGYDAHWGIVGAHHAGAPHKRDRIWIVADASELLGNVSDDYTRIGMGKQSLPQFGNSSRQEAVADSESTRLERHRSDAGESEISEPWNDGASMADANSGLRVRRTDKPEREEEGRAAAGGGCEDVSDPESRRQPMRGRPPGQGRHALRNDMQTEGRERECWWATEPDVGRVAHGVAARVDRLRCIGNGQVPAVAVRAWHLLKPET
jgi:DNA (cytosine-5)-methyltransferase 1